MWGLLAKKAAITLAKKASQVDPGDLLTQDTVSSVAKGAYHLIKLFF